VAGTDPRVLEAGCSAIGEIPRRERGRRERVGPRPTTRDTTVCLFRKGLGSFHPKNQDEAGTLIWARLSPRPSGKGRPAGTRPIPVGSPPIVYFLFLLTLLLQEPEAPVPEPGTLRWQAPQPTDVLRSDVPVHDDQTGGAGQVLLQAKGGVRGGFGLVWRDQRDGSLGLYFQSLAGDGERRDVDRPIHGQRTTRMLNPDLALAADGSGGLVWVYSAAKMRSIHVRFFGPDGRFLGRDYGIETRQAGKMVARGADASEFEPAIGAYPGRGALVAWRDRTALKVQAFDGRYRLEGELLTLGLGERLATGDVRVVCGLRRRALVAYESGGAVVLLPFHRGEPQEPLLLQEGPLLDMTGDGAGGVWILFGGAEGGSPHARRMNLDGAPIEPARPWRPPASTRVTGFTALRGGLAALVVDQKTGGDPRIVLSGIPGREDTVLSALPEGAVARQDLVLTTDGRSLLVAWTDDGAGNPDVHAALVSLEEEQAALGPAMRVNSDQASAPQDQSDLVGGTERALVLWRDQRGGSAKLFARTVSADGTLGEEWSLPRLAPGESAAGVPATPTAAVDAAGTYLVAWTVLAGRDTFMRCQAMGPDGEPKGPPRSLDPGQPVARKDPCAVAALPDAAGFAVVWTRPDGGLMGRVVGPAGELAEAPRWISAADQVARRPSCTLLDDGRVLVVWDAPRADKDGFVLRGRFLSPAGRPQGDVLVFPPRSGLAEWDPALAPAQGGGFLLTWCQGAPKARSTDIYAQLYDARARAAAPPLLLSSRQNEQDFPEVTRLADGSFLAAWEDDLSGFDHTNARRIDRDARTLGPTITLNERETLFNQTRQRPSVAPLGEGFIGIWADRRRSRGFDVYLRVLGPAFDDL